MQTRVIEVNTMNNPSPKFRDETERVQCSKCGNYFLAGGMAKFNGRHFEHDMTVPRVTGLHLELCEGDAAATLVKVDRRVKELIAQGAI